MERYSFIMMLLLDRIHSQMKNRDWTPRPSDIRQPVGCPYTDPSSVPLSSIAIQILRRFSEWPPLDFGPPLSLIPRPLVASATGPSGPLLSADLWLPITSERDWRVLIRHDIKKYGCTPSPTPPSRAAEH